MISENVLRTIMPDLPAARRLQMVPFIEQALQEFGIDRPARAAAFLAQLAHESGQLRLMEEIWGPTEAQRRYEPVGPLAARLGNTQAGDGRRYKGRGPIQITGRANYRNFGRLLAVDLETEPERAARADLGFRVAGVFWQQNGLNELADRASPAAFRAITKRINGGFNGLADREQFYARAAEALGVAIRPDIEGARGVPEAPRVLDRGFEAIRSARRRPARRQVAKERAIKKKRAIKSKPRTARKKSRKR
jgi:putative chitinase